MSRCGDRSRPMTSTRSARSRRLQKRPIVGRRSATPSGATSPHPTPLSMLVIAESDGEARRRPPSRPTGEPRRVGADRRDRGRAAAPWRRASSRRSLETALARREGRGRSHPPLGLRCRRHRRPVHGRSGVPTRARAAPDARAAAPRDGSRLAAGRRRCAPSARRRRRDVAPGEQPGVRRRPRPGRLDARRRCDGARRKPWFDPAGFLLAWRGDALAGFCWTRCTRRATERPRGARRDLRDRRRPRPSGDRTRSRARRRWSRVTSHERGADVGMLFVDGANTAAIASLPSARLPRASASTVPTSGTAR